MVYSNIKSTSEKETLYIIPFVKDTFWSKDYKEVLQMFNELQIPLRNIICIESTDIVTESNFDRNFYKKLYEVSGLTFYKINLIEDNAICIEGFDTLLYIINKRLLEKDYFVKIIMNPPYKGSLHLEILNRMIEVFPNAEIVNLSPANWLLDPLAKSRGAVYKRYKQLIAYIKSLEIIDRVEANRIFGIEQQSDFGIYFIDSEGGWEIPEMDSILKKVYTSEAKLNKAKGLIGFPIIKYADSKKDSYVVLIDAFRRGHVASSEKITEIIRSESNYGKYYHNRISDNGRTLEENKQHNKRSTHGNPQQFDCVEFSSQEEALNFRDYVHSKFFLYVLNKTTIGVHVYPEHLPFMPDYTRPWTDQELYEYFELTDEEIQTVEDFFKER